MKNFFIKIFLIFTFILNISVNCAFSQFLEISSVSFDNSAAFILLNSTDNLDYSINKSDIKIDEEKNEAYFEIQPARINTDKSYIIDSNDIKEINVKQISTNPDVVGTSIIYKNNFNPNNIKLKRLNNSIFISLNNPTITNYYFQDVYRESQVNNIDEKINIQEKIQSHKNVIGEINSAFANSPTEDENFVLASKNLILKSKYYISGMTIKGDIPILNGIGVYTLSKPMYLTNPNRVVFDIKNAVANPLMRNRDIQIGTDTIKIGQFNHNTVRIVITSENPDNYIPILYGDLSKLAFINPQKTSPLNLYTTTSNMTLVTKEKNDTNNYSIKFAFSRPITFGLKRTPNTLELHLYNLNNYFTGAISSELRATPFENIKMADIKSGGVKLIFPINDPKDIYDVFTGADGKTLRIKLKTEKEYIPKEEPFEEIVITPPVYQPRNDGKRYVVIDAGHGGSDCGALRNNINEKDITLDIAKKVQAQLEKKGYIVAMTRTDDTYVSLQDRVDFSEIFNPDIFISIHVNSSNSDTPSGIETHYYKENSLKLAKYLHASMLNNINTKDRGLFKSKFYVINHTTAPAILIETGFISNPNERAQLITESRKNATAKAIVEGIDEYFKK